MHDVKIKNRSNQVGELAAPIADSYDKNTSVDSVSNSNKNVKKSSKDSDENAKYSLSVNNDIEQFLFDAELTLINSNLRRLIKHNGNYR